MLPFNSLMPLYWETCSQLLRRLPQVSTTTTANLSPYCPTRMRESIRSNLWGTTGRQPQGFLLHRKTVLSHRCITSRLRHQTKLASTGTGPQSTTITTFTSQVVPAGATNIRWWLWQSPDLQGSVRCSSPQLYRPCRHHQIWMLEENTKGHRSDPDRRFPTNK